MARKEVLSRLSQLADELQTSYKAMGDRMATEVDPVNQILKKIGVTMPAEPATFFAQEQREDGSSSSFGLCAARGKNRECRLFVEVHECPPGSGEDKEPLVRLEAPDTLPLPIRVRILGVLDSFLESYEAHVRESRKGLLDSSWKTKAGAEAKGVSQIQKALESIGSFSKVEAKAFEKALESMRTLSVINVKEMQKALEPMLTLMVVNVKEIHESLEPMHTHMNANVKELMKALKPMHTQMNANAKELLKALEPTHTRMNANAKEWQKALEPVRAILDMHVKGIQRAFSTF